MRAKLLQRSICAMLNPLAVIIGALRPLRERCGGNVAILFALAAIPVIIGAGIAMDTARAYMAKTRLGAALDAAALAVGSKTNQTSAQLTAELQNYFYDNYCTGVPSGASVTACSNTVAGETSISVQAVGSIIAPTVTYQAQATVPMSFMRLVGIPTITVAVTAQTTKFPGMEIAVVLDNTGSMLCGANDGAPNYSDSLCAQNVVTADTTCTSGTNQSRICTLINAGNQFVATLQTAITAPQSIYMSIVPYVTTVNVGGIFCTNSTTCSHITTDATSGAFTDLRGNIMPVTPITGNTTGGSTTISTISAANIAAIQAGVTIYGPGIQPNATVSSVSSSSIVISSNATLTYTGASLTVGSRPTTVTQSTAIGVMGPTTSTGLTATWTTASASVTSIAPNANGTTAGMYVAGCTTTGSTACGTTIIPSGDSVLSTPATGATSITLTPTKPGTAETTKQLYISAVKGTASSGGNSVTSVNFLAGSTDCTGSTASISSIIPGMLVSGPGIPYSATAPYYVTAASGTTITLSANAASGATTAPLMFTNQGGNTTNASPTINCVSLPNVPAVGTVISGNGIPANTTITAAPSTAAQYLAGTGTLTISQNATKTNNTNLNIYQPITYDSAYNTVNGGGTGEGGTTQNWGGCVIEPTSSGENAAGTGVLAVAGNPDTSEPATGAKWYPFWSASSTANSWPAVVAQNQANEPQGAVVAHYDQNPGPNQGCPVPLLPLTDLTTTAGRTTITNAIKSMWPRDSGGTQVHVGLTWGWRALSPNGPFAANNGHPLVYADSSSQGWKKIIVLMTDGSEEFPFATDYTGFGSLSDGKLGTATSTATAQTNLDTRLQTTCDNIKASNDNGTKNFMIYTIGLGTDGASNTILQNCAGNGGFFSAATPTNLQQVFQNIANSIIHLRLTQ